MLTSMLTHVRPEIAVLMKATMAEAMMAMGLTALQTPLRQHKECLRAPDV
jgi:hypothetical protein